MKSSCLIAALAIASLAVPTVAQAPASSTITVRFAKGASSKTFTGSVKGYATIDYVVGARAGQTMTVKLTSPRSAVFSVLSPSGDALEESIEANDFTGTLPASGNYRVRVGLMRNDARRPVTDNYTLTIKIV